MDKPAIIKYMRTLHLEDSRLQNGDSDHQVLKLADLSKLGEWVIEEKLDGANTGFRFDQGGNILAQSRGHYLDMSAVHSPRERDYSLFKEWLLFHQDTLLEKFEDRYVVYGEWMAICHTIYYDRLPHLFMEFDILDTHTGQMLSTSARRELCEGTPIQSVPILHRGEVKKLSDLKKFVQPSVFKTPSQDGDWLENLERSCNLVGDNFANRKPKMDLSDMSEGLYIKIENEKHVVGRAKWVRPDFVQTILNADEHWQSRFPVPNLLDGQIDMFPSYLSPKGTLHTESYNANEPLDWILKKHVVVFK